MSAPAWVTVCMLLYFFAVVRLGADKKTPPANEEWNDDDWYDK